MNHPTAVLLRSFTEQGNFVIVQVFAKDPQDVAEIPTRIVLYSASNVDEEVIADAFHSSLKEDEVMSVLGGGTLKISNDTWQIDFTTDSSTFGHSDPALVHSILTSAFPQHDVKEKKY
eukprot:TRINITY_DN8949_c0_g1_i1.p1 TRINITY_DN8949_c0_g1~~TRINITY_DN8949_c0_g1_i1.p1  ORF type:complete len:118 (-),score=23.45 TRINITY_DN8949_c0_g1_i1:427-780(-)